MSRRQKAEDYYAVLGVERAASAEAIKAAFKEQAKVLHPDRNQGRNTTAEFQRIHEAYAVLRDPERRRRYDLASSASPFDPRRQTADARHHPVRTGPRSRLVFGVAAAAIVVGIALYSIGSKFGLPWAGSPREPPSDVAGQTGVDQEMQAAIREYANNYAGPRALVANEVVIEGRAGRKLVVSSAVARLLEPKRLKLVASAEQLRERASDLKLRRERLDRDRLTISRSGMPAIIEYNNQAEQFVRDSADFDRDVEAHAREVEAFLVELEHSALRTL